MFLERRVRVASTGVASPPLLTGCDASVVDLHAEPKGSTTRSRGKSCYHLSLGKQVEKGDQKLGSAINAWGLLESAMKATGRNRRVSSSLSPIFYLFLAPAGTLYLNVQALLTHDEAHDVSPPPILSNRRPGPKHPRYGIPTELWPMVMHRVVENHEPLRAVAHEYGVSHETIRRSMLHVQNQRGWQEA